MIAPEVHGHDTGPQRVIRSLAARPTGRAGETRIDKTRLDGQAETAAQIVRARFIDLRSGHEVYQGRFPNSWLADELAEVIHALETEIANSV